MIAKPGKSRTVRQRKPNEIIIRCKNCNRTLGLVALEKAPNVDARIGYVVIHCQGCWTEYDFSFSLGKT